MDLNQTPAKIYDTIFFFIEYFYPKEIENGFINVYESTDFMISCYDQVKPDIGSIPSYLSPLFLYNREIKLEWSGDKRALPTAEEEISRVQASIIKWYASEYHNGRQVLDEIQTPSAINSELYTKMIYLTRNWSLYPNGDGCVTISSPEIKNKYPAAICLALGFFLSIVISVMFCLVKKMVDEYQQNSGQ